MDENDEFSIKNKISGENEASKAGQSNSMSIDRFEILINTPLMK